MVSLAAIVLALASASMPAAAQDTLPIEVIRKAYYDSYQLEAKERFVDAVNALAPVQKAYGNTYTVNYRAGWLFYRNKSWAESLKHYRKALAVSPTSLEVLLAIMNTLAAKQDWSAVAEQGKRVLQVDYNHFSANLWLIIADQALGNREPAKKNAYRMLALYPTSVPLLVELGKIQYAEADFAAATTTFTSVQILDPYNPTASQYLGLLQHPKP